MNSTTLTPTICLHRPWSTRAAGLIAAGWARLRTVVATARARWHERRAEEDVLELDEATLRDMGAPLWMLEEARVRRESRRFDRGLLHVHDELGTRPYY